MLFFFCATKACFTWPDLLLDVKIPLYILGRNLERTSAMLKFASFENTNFTTMIYKYWKTLKALKGSLSNFRMTDWLNCRARSVGSEPQMPTGAQRQLETLSINVAASHSLVPNQIFWRKKHSVAKKWSWENCLHVLSFPNSRNSLQLKE